VVVRVAETPADGASEEWSLGLRIPAWCPGARLVVAGTEVPATPDERGYVRVTRHWQRDDTVRLELDMPPRLVHPHRRIDALRDCVAVERGPLVYCFEQVDQAPDVALVDLAVAPDAGVRVVDQPAHPVLGRTVLLEVDAAALASPADATGPAYSTEMPQPAVASRTTAIAVPYFQWDNRDGGAMRVWLPELTS
jgi:uncharacterized protein